MDEKGKGFNSIPVRFSVMSPVISALTGLAFDLAVDGNRLVLRIIVIRKSPDMIFVCDLILPIKRA